MCGDRYSLCPVTALGPNCRLCRSTAREAERGEYRQAVRIRLEHREEQA